MRRVRRNVTTTKGIAPTVSAPLPAEPKGSTGRRSGRLPYGLLVPSLLAIAVALGYPLVRQVVLSLQEYGLAQQFGRPAEWVGLKNYTTSSATRISGLSCFARWCSVW